ncbi:hypothetical protein IAT38_004761 [Cryptococcus sp. DSM 104549]
MLHQISNIDQYLAEKRALLTRLNPQQASRQTNHSDSTYLIDIRPISNREEEGTIPGAIIIERNVLEWRLDPTSPHNITEARKSGFTPIIVCNEGYASSLAAVILRELGIASATDLEGGFRAWKREGLPVISHIPPSQCPSIDQI